MNRLQQKTRSCSLLLLAACRPKQSQLLPYSWKMVNGSESLLRLEYQARSLLSRSPRSALAGSSAVPNLDLTSTVSPWRPSCSHHRSLPLSFLVNGNIYSWWSRSEDTTRPKSPSSIVPATQSLQFRTGFCEKSMTGGWESNMRAELWCRLQAPDETDPVLLHFSRDRDFGFGFGW
jgi:hypothetical protein